MTARSLSSLPRRGAALARGADPPETFGRVSVVLAARGWDVTAADLSAWAPDVEYDLVTTHYAHRAMPQLEFYDRIAGWVAPGGTLLVVGHLHTPDSPEHGHGHHPPAEASVTLADITARLDGARWEVVTAEEHVRTTTGRATPLHDVVVRATGRCGSRLDACRTSSCGAGT